MIVAALALFGATWSASGADIPVRALAVHHEGATLEAQYRAQVVIETRQIGMSPPNRPSTARCLWRAVMTPERLVMGANTRPIDALARKFDDHVIANGSQPGQCTAGQKAIGTQVARAVQGAAPDRLAALADRDHATLKTDLTVLSAGLKNDAG